MKNVQFYALFLDGFTNWALVIASSCRCFEQKTKFVFVGWCGFFFFVWYWRVKGSSEVAQRASSIGPKPCFCLFCLVFFFRSMLEGLRVRQVALRATSLGPKPSFFPFLFVFVFQRQQFQFPPKKDIFDYLLSDHLAFSSAFSFTTPFHSLSCCFLKICHYFFFLSFFDSVVFLSVVASFLSLFLVFFSLYFLISCS